MNRDDIIRVAREAGIARWHKDLKCWVVEPGLDRFVALATAAEREARQAAQTQVAELQERLNRADAEKCAAVLAEREACGRAKSGKPRALKPVGSGALLDSHQYCFDKGWREGAASVRAAIRARSNT